MEIIEDKNKDQEEQDNKSHVSNYEEEKKKR